MSTNTKSISRMTKAELLDLVKDLTQESEHLKRQLDEVHENHQETGREMEALRKQLTEGSRKSQGLCITSDSDLLESMQDCDIEQHHELILKYKSLEREHSELVGHYEEIRKLLVRNRDNFTEMKTKFDRLLEVKKSLTDNDKYGQILIDYRYFIRFINKNASEKLQYEDLYEYVDQKIFKLFDYDNGIIVKKKIDKVLLEKKDKALSDVLCQVSESKKAKLKGELHATSFEDKPAVLFVFK
ncbi:MAG: hypothetical protein MJE63_01510 [Proteobacteria bacterium]|nr:hypothetical protein [Pseudomonadota bacterium]